MNLPLSLYHWDKQPKQGKIFSPENVSQILLVLTEDEEGKPFLFQVSIQSLKKT